MLAILKRELKSYFHTPSGYVFLTVWFIFFGLFFFRTNIFPQMSPYGMGSSPATANMGDTIGTMVTVLLFIIPILVMKVISEERRQKTDQLLHTVPISTFEIVVAKYLGALSVFVIALALSLIYPSIIWVITKASFVAMKYLIAVYLGFFLLGASFIAICVFASAITESQIVAAILGFCFILTLWLMQIVRAFTTTEWLQKVIDWISLLKRYDDFISGVIRISPILYYISVIIIFLFLTVRAIDKRRWTEG